MGQGKRHQAKGSTANVKILAREATLGGRAAAKHYCDAQNSLFFRKPSSQQSERALKNVAYIAGIFAAGIILIAAIAALISSCHEAELGANNSFASPNPLKF